MKVYNTRSKKLKDKHISNMPKIDENSTMIISTPLPVLHHHNHHVYQNRSANNHVWNTPLFSFGNIPRYISSIVCPCGVISNIMSKLLSIPNKTTYEPYCCSTLSYTLLPCLYHGYLYAQTEENEGGLLDYIYYTPPTSATGIETGSPTYFAFMVCLGTLCVIPASCMVRQITTIKYDIQEPIWTTGLISCFAWPCGLVQVSDELNYEQESHK
jgi:hypothetical protein